MRIHHALRAAASGASQISPTVYGIAQVSTGGGAGSWQWVDKDGNNLTLTTTDFDSHPIWGGIADETVDGQAMVKIPKFYYLEGVAPTGSDQAGNKCWWIGDGAFSVDGTVAEVHPAFFDGGSEVDQIWVGKYEGYAETATLIGSASGQSPLNYTTFTDYATYCDNRNEANGGNTGQTGWHLWSMYELGAVQMLALIELGTPDVQTAIGAGNTSGGATVKTGTTNAVYRGISELWGNIYHWTHGLEIDGSGVVKMWDRIGNQTWINTGVTALHSTFSPKGWSVTMHTDRGADYDLADVFLPATIDGTESNGTFADYFFGSDSVVNKVLHGGNSPDGSWAGLFYLYCGDAASVASSYAAGRLGKV